jgi:hypothetical protein
MSQSGRSAAAGDRQDEFLCIPGGEAARRGDRADLRDPSRVNTPIHLPIARIKHQARSRGTETSPSACAARNANFCHN